MFLQPVRRIFPAGIAEQQLLKCYLLRTTLFCSDVQSRYSSENSGSGKGKSPVRLMGLGSAVSRKENQRVRKPRSKIKSLSRADLIDPDTTDWSSVYVAAQSYNPSVIPLPLRMGRPRHNRLGDIPPNDRGNVELLKIPNFFHLTPPAIKKHCDALKEYCTPWPDDIGSLPIRITTINYIFAGPSVRHPDSRRVKLQVFLKDLELDEHARKKLILLVGDRFNAANDELTLITDSCPTRKQNKDYAYYLLTALYHESWKVESWESEAEGKDEQQLKEEVEKVATELNPKDVLEKSKRRRHYRVIGNRLVRYNNQGHPFVYDMRKYGISGGLSETEMSEAKEEWKNMQKELPDTSTFDPVYKRNSESEFIN